MLRRPLEPVALLVLAAVAGSCSDGAPETTWVDLRFFAEDASLARATSLSVIVFDTEGGIALGETLSLTGDGAVALPAGARLLPEDGDPRRRYRVVAELIDDGGTPFSRVRATGTYVEDVGTRLDLWFADACADVLCADGQTCLDGGCVGACFEPRADVAEGRDEPVRCPGSAPVYVDATSGTDHPQRCTDDATPCATIQYAVDTYPLPGLGTVINVRGGTTYAESVSLRENTRGDADAPTVLRAWPDTGRPIIDASGAEVGVSICCGDGAPGHVLVESIDVTGASDHGVLVSGAGATAVSVRDVILRANGAAPSTDDGGSGITVTDGATMVTFTQSEVLDNVSTEGPPTRGVVVDGAFGVSIVDNLVRGTSANGIRVEAGANVLVSGNTIRDGRTNGITFWGDGHQATFNVLCDNGGVGIRAIDTSGLVIEHNSFLNHGSYSLELAGASTGTVFRSNAVVNSGGPAVTSVSEDPVTSHNIFHANSGSYDGAALGDSTDRGDTDPLFVDRRSCDVNLMPGSPAIGTAHDGGNVGAL